MVISRSRRYLVKLSLVGMALTVSGDVMKRFLEDGKPAPKERETAPATGPKIEQTGEASWYGPGFHGKQTASGETYDQNDMTAASPHLPLGSKAEVTNVETGKKVQVEITDRGPYAKGRVLDLSHAAAKKLGIVKKGTGRVKVEVRAKRKTKSHKHHKQKKPR